MQVEIDRGGCIGCGLCADTCPAVFAIAGDGLAEVIARPGDAQASAVREAADNCPVSVIAVEE